MKARERTCEREVEVRRMVSGGIDSPAIRRHAASCGACRQTLAIANGMRELAGLSLGTSSLLSSTTLWWKAQALRRWDGERKVAIRMELGDRMQIGSGLAAAAVLLGWAVRHLPTLATPAGLPASLKGVMFASAVLLVATTLIAVREMLAWERTR